MNQTEKQRGCPRLTPEPLRALFLKAFRGNSSGRMDPRITKRIDRGLDALTIELGLLTRTLQAPLGDVWQPIETAPKDKKVILGVWSGDVFYQQAGNLYNKQGYMSTVTTGFRKSEYPTHWQPLPQPPAAIGEKQ